MVSHEARRLNRMSVIYDSVKNCGKDGASYAKILAVCMVEFGCSRRTALEYVNTLVLAERIKNVEGILRA